MSAFSPAFEHAQRVQLARAAEGYDQEEATDEAADDGGCDDSRGDDDRTTLLVAAITAVILRVANPRLKHTAVILQRSDIQATQTSDTEVKQTNVRHSGQRSVVSVL